INHAILDDCLKAPTATLFAWCCGEIMRRLVSPVLLFFSLSAVMAADGQIMSVSGAEMQRCVSSCAMQYAKPVQSATSSAEERAMQFAMIGKGVCVNSASCKNDGYCVENGQCRPKKFNIILNTKIPGIPKSMQCVWNDKMFGSGINGGSDGFDDGCSMPLITFPDTRFGLTQFYLCRWQDIDSGRDTQQRITNFFYALENGSGNNEMPIPEDGHTFRVKSVCWTYDNMTQQVDYY
ncbi:MAG: hypothetical protein LBL21_03510, partial [Rickettsiales bacterium]|nr:hypothetical protein [Rickettsiales bacterium]